MKGRAIVLVGLCLLLSGCGWMDGNHVSITPYQAQNAAVQDGSAAAGDYVQLCTVLEQMVDAGQENAVIHVGEYDQDKIGAETAMAVRYLKEEYPLGAYAIDEVGYEVGSSGGQPAVAVNITYLHGRSELRKIRPVSDMEAAEQVVAEILEQCGEGVVLLVENYKETDLVQLVEDYGELHPEVVMEAPQTVVGIYPDRGHSRVIELKFSYQTSRESLRQMQKEVQRIFASADLYVTSGASQGLKYAQLNTFLMERSDYKVETSITPAYSLLSHGVGDCRAFATVYAAMCRQAKLECLVVSGTREGEPWVWNLICEDGVYYHVDLLRSSGMGQFLKVPDEQMEGYVWDYSAYPAAGAVAKDAENNFEENENRA